jgi:hypothetical protein
VALIPLGKEFGRWLAAGALQVSNPFGKDFWLLVLCRFQILLARIFGSRALQVQILLARI